MLCHVQFLRELLDKEIIKYLFWIDTRDTSADGLTKGSVSREALHELMNGTMFLRHAWEQWHSKARQVGGNRVVEANCGGRVVEANSAFCLFSLSYFSESFGQDLCIDSRLSHFAVTQACEEVASSFTLPALPVPVAMATDAPPGIGTTPRDEREVEGFILPGAQELAAQTQEASVHRRELPEGMWVDPASNEIWKSDAPKGVGKTHSVTKIQDYVKGLPADYVASWTDPGSQIPYDHVQDFMATLRYSCKPAGRSSGPATACASRKPSRLPSTTFLLDTWW